ncbi:MAG: radical SAM protein [Candidatus Omnitrophota bacterium]
MKTIQYKDFSLNTHKKNWRISKQNVCQFELTFKCGLHCGHCYCDCYNKPSYIKKELNTEQIKLIIDKIYKLGVIWLCFTGGDPLERNDFLEIYEYAKDKGFLITIFTTGYSLTEQAADYLAKRPPFAIEITINGVTKNTYENITRVKGSYKKAMAGLDMILKRNLPLKVKTMATQQNLEELPKIKEFLESRGLEFRPGLLLQAGLDGDTTPCSLRLKPEQIVELDKLFEVQSVEEDEGGINMFLDCPVKPGNDKRERGNDKKYGNDESGVGMTKNTISDKRLFRCAAGSLDGVNIDPYGKMFMCSCIREPGIDLLKAEPEDIRKMFSVFQNIAGVKIKTDSKCYNCDMIDFCLLCPGKAYLETGDMHKEVEYFCELAKTAQKRIKEFI